MFENFDLFEHMLKRIAELGDSESDRRIAAGDSAFFPTTFMLWVTFSPVPECVEIGLLESSFSDPAAAPSRRPFSES